MKRNTPSNRHPHGEQLSAFCDGMLDLAKSRSVAEHIHGCVDCNQIVAQLEQTKHLLSAMPAPPRPTPDFWTHAYRSLRVNDLERTGPLRIGLGIFQHSLQATRRRLAVGLAAVAVIVTGAMIIPTVTTTQPANYAPLNLKSVPQPQDDTPDVTTLVDSHTDSVSRLPLSDPDRQKMIAADARQAQDAPEGAAYADGAF